MERPLVVNLFGGGGKPNLGSPVAGSEPDKSWAALEAAGFAVETLPAYNWPWNPAARMHSAFQSVDPLRSLRVLLRRRNAAIICAHMESALVPLLLRRMFRFRAPIILWEVPWSPGWAYRELVARLTISRADRAVVFSANQIDLVRQAYGGNARPAFVPFCVDVNFFRPRLRNNASVPYILSSGLDKGRDFDLLVKVSAEIPTPFKIKIANLPASVSNPKMYPNIEFILEHLNYIEFRDLYSNADIVVITTHLTPNACGVTSLMEAMAMGKPTIISNNPALRDYLPPPDAGVVVPIGDAAALRAAILDLQRNPKKAAAMGKNARAFAEQRFHPDVHFRAIADLFWEVAAEAGTATRPKTKDDELKMSET